MLNGLNPKLLSEQLLPDDQILLLRMCYCPKQGQDRSAFEARGIPEGFCGKCDICGEPGHVCHYPGPLPFTGCWCDKHYIIEVREQPRMKAVRELRRQKKENQDASS